MKKFILFIILFSSLNLFSQEEIKQKEFTLTPFAQYGTSYRNLKGNYSIGESPLDTYGYGIRVSYNIKNIAITSGIEYQQFW